MVNVNKKNATEIWVAFVGLQVLNFNRLASIRP